MTAPDSPLHDWLTALSAHLGVELASTVVAPVLDLARDAAHNVMRPAAPLSTFVAGYAAGLAASAEPAGADERTLALIERARQLAESVAAADAAGAAVEPRAIRLVDSSTRGGLEPPVRPSA